MKHLILTVCAVAITAFCCQLQAQPSESEMKAWMDYMTPGDVHKMMAKWDGEWNEEISHWMKPDEKPTKSSASCVNKMILGGRYQESKHSGSFFGSPFEGISTTGYDNKKKIFVSSWVDNMGTGIMNMEGTWDDQTKTMNLSGKCTDPMTGKDCKVRETFKIIDDDTQVMEMYMTQPGQKEYKTMEIKFTRKK